MVHDLDYLLFKEELTVASVPKRFAAFVVDKLLLSLIVYAAMGNQFADKDLEGIVTALNKAFLFTTAIEISYQTLFTALYGATIGKMLVKIRVVSTVLLDNPSFLVSLLRAVSRFLSEMLFYLGFIWVLFDPYRQGWHDKIAKTVVINVK